MKEGNSLEVFIFQLVLDTYVKSLVTKHDILETLLFFFSLHSVKCIYINY